MTAILFGSISTIVDTSELQRQAFNDAFEAQGLGWEWDREEYLVMLEQSGGEQRIAEYASSRGETVDAGVVHRAKSERFRELLGQAQVAPRDGVVETIRDAKAKGYKVGLVTTTSAENVSALLDAVQPELDAADFDVVVDVTQVAHPKPEADAYRFALQELREEPADCVAIEDNLLGVSAAAAADVPCVAFPNQNTAGHRFTDASLRLERLSLSEVAALIPSR